MKLLDDIQAAICEREMSVTLHAQQQMTVRRIKISTVRKALLSSVAEVIEDYPKDPHGSSCLVYGKASNRILHVHISYPPEIVVITAYEPDPAKWGSGHKTRR